MNTPWELITAEMDPMVNALHKDWRDFFDYDVQYSLEYLDEILDAITTVKTGKETRVVFPGNWSDLRLDEHGASIVGVHVMNRAPVWDLEDFHAFVTACAAILRRTPKALEDGAN